MDRGGWVDVNWLGELRRAFLWGCECLTDGVVGRFNHGPSHSLDVARGILTDQEEDEEQEEEQEEEEEMRKR